MIKRPVIQWDEGGADSFGGFRVTENLKSFTPPGDWKVDPNDATHFLPTYEPCRYRRLSRGVKEGRPWCHIHCLLFEEVVDHQTCIDCDVRVEPQEFVMVSLDETPSHEPITDRDDDTVFSAHQPPSKFVKKPTKGTKWVPCKHRRKATEEDVDCGGCGKLICNCEECPLFGKVLSKKDCKTCQYRS